MSITHNDKELIERYLDGDMTPSEIIDFEKKLEEESELSDELALHKTAIESLKKNESLKEELKDIFNEVKQERSASPKTLRPFYWVAAAAVLLVVSTLSIYYLSKAPNTESLYLSYYHPLSGTDVTRDGDLLLVDKGLASAMKLYKQGQFQEAAVEFETLLKRDTINDKWHVYLANCYMNSGQLKQAREPLQKAMNTGGSFTRQHAQWYSTLLDLREGEIKKAQAQLEDMYKSGGVYQREAKALLEELN